MMYFGKTSIHACGETIAIFELAKIIHSQTKIIHSKIGIKLRNATFQKYQIIRAIVCAISYEIRFKLFKERVPAHCYLHTH